jgi:hypothetical protein
MGPESGASLRNKTMGKLLFVNTNRVNGIAGILICAAFAALGVWATLSGNYGWALVIPAGIFGGKFSLKMATQRTEFYEQGFISKNIFGGVRGRYADLKSIVRGAVRMNGVTQTNIHFVMNSGEMLSVSDEKLLKTGDQMQLLLEFSSAALAEVWAKTLESQTEVVWMMKGSAPLLKIRKEGVLVEEKPGAATLIPLAQIQFKSSLPLQVQILNGTESVISVNSGASNYFVGRSLIAKLIENQQRSMVATHRS